MGLKSYFRKLMPTRDSFESYTPVVVDLDRMISKTVAFRFMGNVHKIKPMDQETFLKVMNGLAQLDSLRSKSGVLLEQVRKEYFKLFSQCIDSIDYSDVMKMTDAQIAAILNQIISCVTGKAYGDEEKKNFQKTIPHTA